jgi:hypothetical protein
MILLDWFVSKNGKQEQMQVLRLSAAADGGDLRSG